MEQDMGGGGWLDIINKHVNVQTRHIWEEDEF